jgi:hypothetical protein
MELAVFGGCREATDAERASQKLLWCRGPDSNRQAVKRRIFVTPRLSTPTIPGGILVRALDYAFTIAAELCGKTASPRRLRRPPSSLYTFRTLALMRRRAWLGVASVARAAQNQGVHRI